jgi:hypothetical protein
VVDFGAACDDAYSRIYYVEADYLHWWISGDSAPPLVTTSTPGTPRLQAGVLGQPNTSVLFGGDDLDDDAHPGVRIVLGRWITPYAKIEGEWFDLGTVDSDFSAASNDIPILARPFFNVTSGLQDAFLVAYPGIREGAISVDSSTRFMGAAISVVENWDGACSVRDGQLALAFGLRYLRLEEDLSINDSFTSIDPVGPVPVGTSFTTSDNFDASNDFFGFNVGARTHWQHNRWSLACLGNVAIGQTIRRVSIAGQSTRTIPPGGTTTFNGGLLALPTNIGEYRNTELGVVPQIQVKLGYNVTHNIRLLLAYDGLLWSSVARAGDQIDTNVNLSQASGQPLVGQAAPLFPFRESNLWVHGVSGGVEWRF